MPPRRWCTELGIQRLACIGQQFDGQDERTGAAGTPPGHRRQPCQHLRRGAGLLLAIALLQRGASSIEHPQWNDGAYDDAEHYPENGMRMARKLGVITYRSALEWDGRFGRVRLDSDRREGEDPFGLEFEVEATSRPRALRAQVRQQHLYRIARSGGQFDLGEARR